MSLFYATLATGLFLILCGGSLLFNYNRSRTFLKAFPRSKSATYILMVAAMIWFSLKIYNLGIADFGDYKTLLLAIFLTITVTSFYFVPDFLGVRALAGLTLLIADALLDAAYMQDPASRLFLVSFVYVAILYAFILGASPYFLRDTIDWFYKNQLRVQIFGYLLCIYGALLSYVALNY
ncbi:MAG: hypothetical protein CNB76_00860 [Puniceicoccaceae bacterium MED-G32]|jgi:hypothetical protein|nr:MAG: hypothetical protein CNB76_00860 [Puniceicoccaceae bacterium MED-G32]CAI8280868.1 MAG: Uncharacterised protein [Puniceicoccaceae bacterium MED-G32]